MISVELKEPPRFKEEELLTALLPVSAIPFSLFFALLFVNLLSLDEDLMAEVPVFCCRPI